MTPAQRTNRATVLGLLALQLAWNALGTWGQPSPFALVALGLPLAGVAALQFASRRSAGFWSGVVALLTFCHGIMEAWASPQARLPALLEVVLSVVVVVAASWDGIHARFRRGRERRQDV